MKKQNHLQSLITLSTLALSTGILPAQQDDPFVKEKGKKSDPSTSELFDPSTLPRQIFTTIEIFSLPTEKAAELHRQKTSDAKIYETVVKMVADKKAKQEFLSSLNARPGQRAISTASQKSQKADDPANEDKTPPAGLTLELEAQIGMPTLIPLTKNGAALLEGRKKFNSNDPFGDPAPEDTAALKAQNQKIATAVQSRDIKSITYIDMRLTPTLVEQIATLKTGKNLLELKNIKTAIATPSGVPLLLGTFTPASKLKADGEGQKEVWLAFVTATVKVAGL